ncbi:hypothetical protein P421_13520 [Heyndrickxia coagulans P38]|nr:hypothetical protein P421_13520 [Heyndrickxia coagulans P38]
MEFLVRAAKKVPSPCCGKHMKVIGTRDRKAIDRSGKKHIYNIRRLRCEQCGKIHHELPEFLVPYKRYKAKCIEMVLTNPSNHDVPADESTLYRWLDWFYFYVEYWIHCLVSIKHQTKQDGDDLKVLPETSGTALQRLGRLVGNASGWLARVVRPVVNFYLWVHTRSAFLSGGG